MKRSLATAAAMTLFLCAGVSSARAAEDPAAILNQVLANLSTSPRITSTMATEGNFKLQGRLIVNADKRFVYQRIVENGHTTSRTVETSRLKYSHVAKRRCWTKRRKRLNIDARFRDMKRRNSEIEQLAPDLIAYTHDDEFGVFRVEMRFDPGTLLPSLFTANYIDDGQGVPQVTGYRMTFAYSATDTVPRHRPVCKRS